MAPKRKYAFAVGLICLSVALGAHFYWLDGIWGGLCEVILGETVFSPGYREYKFRHITLNMTSNQVCAIMGNPLRVLTTRDPGEEIWFYTKPKVWDQKGLGPNCNYTERCLFLSNGVVTLKCAEFDFD
jgi:hypothetical protein